MGDANLMREYFRRISIREWAGLTEDEPGSERRRAIEQALDLTPQAAYEEAVTLLVGGIALPPYRELGGWMIGDSEAWLRLPEEGRRLALASLAAHEAAQLRWVAGHQEKPTGGDAMDGKPGTD